MYNINLVDLIGRLLGSQLDMSGATIGFRMFQNNVNTFVGDPGDSSQCQNTLGTPLVQTPWNMFGLINMLLWLHMYFEIYSRTHPPGEP